MFSFWGESIIDTRYLIREKLPEVVEDSHSPYLS